MRLLALASFAFAVSLAGGTGFPAAGTDVTDPRSELQKVADPVAPNPFPGSNSDCTPL